MKPPTASARPARPPAAKPPANILHFFPGPRLLIWTVGGKPAAKAEAWGGVGPTPGHPDVRMEPQKTTPGRYVIHSYAPYRTKTWELSRVAWGTPIKTGADPRTGKPLILYRSGVEGAAWKPIEKLIPAATVDVVKALHFELYGSARVPDTWVFNDFGPMAVRYFKDANRNRKLGKGEALSGEMIHTTPKNEAQTALGKDVELETSHGCIHVKPADRDRLNRAGAFAPGTDLWVHDYADAVPPELL
jgi:hypothetical protein